MDENKLFEKFPDGCRVISKRLNKVGVIRHDIYFTIPYCDDAEWYICVEYGEALIWEKVSELELY